LRQMHRRKVAHIDGDGLLEMRPLCEPASDRSSSGRGRTTSSPSRPLVLFPNRRDQSKTLCPLSVGISKGMIVGIGRSAFVFFRFLGLTVPSDRFCVKAESREKTGGMTLPRSSRPLRQKTLDKSVSGMKSATRFFSVALIHKTC